MEFVSFDESMEALKSSIEGEVFSERVFIEDALGRVLSEDIVADHNSPDLPTSAMDGYALKFEDQALGRLRLQGLLPAGEFKEEELLGGFCIKCFTGSVVCCGADTVIPIENVEIEGDEVVIKEEVEYGANVRPIGENYKEGEILIKKGVKIGFAEIGVLASLNISQVSVAKRPKVAILSTGSEILDVGETKSNPSQIRSSNQFTLSALTKKAGADPIRMPLQRDDKKSIEKAIKSALENSDIVVTTGGVSVGDFDFVKEILSNLEASYITKGVVLKPGQHIKIVKVGKKYIFALPGFPYSSTVTFILYLLPLIRAMMGMEFSLPTKEARLSQSYKKKSRKTEVTAVNLRYGDGEYKIDFRGKRSGSSAILTNMLNSSALMISDEKEGDKEAGEMVRFIDLDALLC
jgi:molybdopterin molybdotransferase